MKNQKSILEIIKRKALEKRNKIGISILHESKGLMESLKKAQDEIADVVIYGDHEINGFETKVYSTEEEIGRAMVQDFKNGEIDQFVRGQVDDFGVVDEFKNQFDISKEEKRVTFALLEDFSGNQFFLCLASNPEGQTYKDKKRIVDSVTTWMKNEFNLNPKVAVMATCRPQSLGKDLVMTKSYEDAEKLVNYLKDNNIEAKNIHIELQSAVPWANLVVASNGTIGNQIFRAMVLLGGGRCYSVPTLFLDGAIYEDNSRNETDYYYHIIFASSFANK